MMNYVSSRLSSGLNDLALIDVLNDVARDFKGWANTVGQLGDFASRGGVVEPEQLTAICDAMLLACEGLEKCIKVISENYENA